MTKCIRGGLPVALAVLAVCAPGAGAAPVPVSVRVEGLTSTIFDGPVATDAQSVTTPSGGTNPCDGTASGDGLPPGPTATGALDDAAALGGFGWDGTYGDFGIQDYFISRVADETADPASEFWSLFIDRKTSDLGGCQKRVAAGQEVLWARVSFTGPTMIPLELRGPGVATTGQPVNVQVVDGESGAPQAGATVQGSATGSDGVATVTFADAGVYRLKAEKPGAIRSNALVVCADPPGAAPCTSTDRVAPTVTVRLPGRRLASERGRSRTMLISWQADDAAGAGVSHYAVDVREPGGEWRPVVERTTLTGVHFRGQSGHAYQFRITAVDRATNRTSIETDPVLLPVDDRDRGLWRFSRGWKRLRSEAAWGGTVMRASDEGATATFRFDGQGVSLLGRKLPKGGRLRVTVDGRSRALRLRGSTAPRSVLWTSRRLRDGRHRLRVRALGGGSVELDAVVPWP